MKWKNLLTLVECICCTEKSVRLNERYSEEQYATILNKDRNKLAELTDVCDRWKEQNNKPSQVLS